MEPSAIDLERAENEERDSTVRTAPRVGSSSGERARVDSDAPADASLCTADQRVDRGELLGRVYRQMRALRPGAKDADDLVQVAVEQVLRALPSFEGRSQLSTWTYRICYLTVLKHDRWYRRWLRRFTLTAAGELPEMSGGDSPADIFERRERAARLEHALAKLSAKRRTVLVLHDLEGREVDEVAEIVGANARTVRSRLRDARLALARILADDAYFGDEACDEESP